MVSDGPAVFLSHGSMHSVSLGADGVVATAGAGGSYPIHRDGDFGRLDTAGQIICGGNTVGVYLTGFGINLVNTGRIDGGVYVAGDFISFSNSGLITGSRGGQ